MVQPCVWCSHATRIRLTCVSVTRIIDCAAETLHACTTAVTPNTARFIGSQRVRLACKNSIQLVKMMENKSFNSQQEMRARDECRAACMCVAYDSGWRRARSITGAVRRTSTLANCVMSCEDYIYPHCARAAPTPVPRPRLYRNPPLGVLAINIEIRPKSIRVADPAFAFCDFYIRAIPGCPQLRSNYKTTLNSKHNFAFEELIIWMIDIRNF